MQLKIASATSDGTGGCTRNVRVSSGASECFECSARCRSRNCCISVKTPGAVFIGHRVDLVDCRGTIKNSECLASCTTAHSERYRGHFLCRQLPFTVLSNEGAQKSNSSKRRCWKNTQYQRTTSRQASIRVFTSPRLLPQARGSEYFSEYFTQTAYS